MTDATHIPTPPFVAIESKGSARGHDERSLGRKLKYCYACKAKKPPGGWSHACPKDARTFMGGE